MPRRYRQLRMRDPDVFLLLPATPLVHRHARILRTIPVDHTTSFVHVPDLHHRLLASIRVQCGILELEAKLRGDLDERSPTNINVTLDPQTAKRIAETYLERRKQLAGAEE